MIVFPLAGPAETHVGFRAAFDRLHQRPFHALLIVLGDEESGRPLSLWERVRVRAIGMGIRDWGLGIRGGGRAEGGGLPTADCRCRLATDHSPLAPDRSPQPLLTPHPALRAPDRRRHDRLHPAGIRHAVCGDLLQGELLHLSVRLAAIRDRAETDLGGVGRPRFAITYLLGEAAAESRSVERLVRGIADRDLFQDDAGLAARQGEDAAGRRSGRAAP